MSSKIYSNKCDMEIMEMKMHGCAFAYFTPVLLTKWPKRLIKMQEQNTLIFQQWLFTNGKLISQSHAINLNLIKWVLHENKNENEKNNKQIQPKLFSPLDFGFPFSISHIQSHTKWKFHKTFRITTINT